MEQRKIDYKKVLFQVGTYLLLLAFIPFWAMYGTHVSQTNLIYEIIYIFIFVMIIIANLIGFFTLCKLYFEGYFFYYITIADINAEIPADNYVSI